jgi:Mg-chelatase subunit ChlD
MSARNTDSTTEGSPDQPTAADAARRGKVGLLGAVAVSLMAHGVIAWSVHDQPIGRIDPSMLGREQLVHRVTLLAPDEMLATDALARADDVAADEAIDLQALSESLLNPEAPPPAAPFAPVELRALDESPLPHEQPGDGLTPPETVWAPGVQEKLIGSPSLEIAFVPDAPESGGGAGGAPSGHGSTAVSRAQALLARAGVTGTVNPRPPALEPPGITERAAIDRRIVNTPMASAPINFAELALSGATALNVPAKLDHDFNYDLHVYREPQGPGYFRVDVTGRDTLVKLQAMPKDVVLLIDTSGSVPQRWVKAVIEGVKGALASFNHGDRFNLVLFDEQPAFFSSNGIRPYDHQNLAAARSFLDGASSRGYTDLNEAISRLLVRDVRANRVYYLILISDGRPTRGVMDTRELLNRITRENNLAASIYCVGIGRSQNQQLLNYLAYRNKGYCLFVPKIEAAGTTIRDLVSRLRYPILKDVRFDVVGVSRQEVLPHRLPNIHQGERMQIFGRFDPQLAGPFTTRVLGLNQGRRFDFTFQRDLRSASAGDSGIARAWAFQKLHALYSQLLEARDPGPIKAQIDQLRRRFQLKTLY